MTNDQNDKAASSARYILEDLNELGRETETCQYEVELLSWGFRRNDEVKALRKKTGTLDQIAIHLQKYFENI